MFLSFCHSIGILYIFGNASNIYIANISFFHKNLQKKFDFLLKKCKKKTKKPSDLTNQKVFLKKDIITYLAISD